MVRRTLAPLLSLALLAASCSVLGGDGDDASSAAGVDGDGATATTLAPTTTTTLDLANPRPGGDSIGDPLFPGIGNTGYDVQHHDIAIDVSGDEFRAEATVELLAEAPLTQLNLDLVGMTVDNVFVDGIQATFERDGRELVITPASTIPGGATAAVKVEYRGTPEPVDDPSGPVPLGWITTEWGSYVLGQPIGAATWFPTNDHPSDKATFVIRVTVDEGLAAVGPGLLISETTTATRTTYVWATIDPMAPYLASVVTGDFAVVSSPETEPVIRHALPTARASQLLPALAATTEMIETFEALFGPYPFESYGVVAVPEDLPYALENQTLSLFDVPFLTERRRTVEAVLAHELAHQWFGNHVSPATWADIWLSEGFATWAEYHWTELDGGETFDDRARTAAGQVLRPPTEVTASSMFDTTVYTRGALTLEALRREIGDDRFFDLLQAWSGTYGGGVASTDDFLRMVRAREGVGAEELVRSWLEDTRMPSLPPRG